MNTNNNQPNPSNFPHLAFQKGSIIQYALLPSIPSQHPMAVERAG